MTQRKTIQGSKRSTHSLAQQMEQFLSHCALGLFLIGLSHGLGLVALAFSEAYVNYFDVAQGVLTIPAVLLVASSMVRFFRARHRAPSQCPEGDSFSASMFREAGFRTFNFVFVGLVAVKALESTTGIAWPLDLFLEGLLAAVMIFYAVTFWVLIRDTQTGE